MLKYARGEVANTDAILAGRWGHSHSTREGGISNITKGFAFESKEIAINELVQTVMLLYTISGLVFATFLLI